MNRRPTTETELEATLQAQLTETAEILGWSWLHLRPARTAHGWRTPVQGPLGKGWPDLILVRPRDGRRIAAELKGPTGQATPEQLWTLEILAAAGFETYLWRPRDFDAAAAILR